MWNLCTWKKCETHVSSAEAQHQCKRLGGIGRNISCNGPLNFSKFLNPIVFSFLVHPLNPTVFGFLSCLFVYFEIYENFTCVIYITAQQIFIWAWRFQINMVLSFTCVNFIQEKSQFHVQSISDKPPWTVQSCVYCFK